jgi:hypothetical protein
VDRNRKRQILKHWFFGWVFTVTVMVVGGGGFFPENEITSELRGLIAKHFPSEIVEPVNAYLEVVGVTPLPPLGGASILDLSSPQSATQTAVQTSRRTQPSQTDQTRPKPEDPAQTLEPTQAAQATTAAAQIIQTPLSTIPGDIKWYGPKEYEKPLPATPTPEPTTTVSQTIEPVTLTPDATLTSTQAATRTPPPAASATALPTQTSTQTPLPSATFRPRPTLTFTPKATKEPSEPTSTAPPPSLTASITNTPPPTWTPIPSDTPTITPTPSETPTITPAIPPTSTPTPINQAPVAVNDNGTVMEDSSITILVLYNDSDPDGDPLTITGYAQGANGSVSQNGDSLTYTPNADYFGSDSFSYTISDGNGGTDSASVNITVVNVNDPPNAANDTGSTTAGNPTTINVLGNDSDPEGDPLTVASVTQGSHGSVSNNGSNVTYTPNAGFTGTDSFTYTISDGYGGSDTATVVVTVNP